MTRELTGVVRTPAMIAHPSRQGNDLPSEGADGRWTVSYAGDALGGSGDTSGTGIPGWFIVLTVLFGLIGIGVTVMKVSYARRMATDAGMDPDRAAAATLLGNDGLDATYIASSVRRAAPPASSPGAAPRGASARLRELQQLRDDGLVTAEEYDARRRAIVDSV